MTIRSYLGPRHAKSIVLRFFSRTAIPAPGGWALNRNLPTFSRRPFTRLAFRAVPVCGTDLTLKKTLPRGTQSCLLLRADFLNLIAAGRRGSAAPYK